MIVESKNYKTVVWWVWGGLDALYLGWYMISSLRKSKTPYLTDALSTLELLRDQGPVQIVMVAVSWGLQLSIFISCILFLTGRDEAKWVGYLQLPLRLFFLVPSVSILLIGVQFFPGYSPVLMVAFIAGSEVIKGWSLWAFGRRQVVH